MHRFKSKKARVGLVLAVAMVIVSVALAAFLAAGSGTSAGQNADTVAITVTPSATQSAVKCYPSATAKCNTVVDVSSAAGNPPITLDKWQITAAGAFVSANTTACPNASWVKADGNGTYVNLPAPVALAPGATVTLQLVGSSRLQVSAPDNCQGIGFTLTGAEVVGHLG